MFLLFYIPHAYITSLDVSETILRFQSKTISTDQAGVTNVSKVRSAQDHLYANQVSKIVTCKLGLYEKTVFKY